MKSFLPHLIASGSLMAFIVLPAPAAQPAPLAPLAPVASAKGTEIKDSAAVRVSKRLLEAAVDPDVALGYQNLKEGQWMVAQESYARALQRYPTQRDALLGLAYTYQALGNVDLAKTTVRRLLDLHPRDEEAVSAFYLMGGGGSGMRDVSDVRDPFEMAESRLKYLLTLNDQSALLHYTLGVIYTDQGRLAQAQQHFGFAFALKPRHADYAYNLALILDQLNQRTEAAVQYAVALDLAKQTPAVFNRQKAQERLHFLLSHP